MGVETIKNEKLTVCISSYGAELMSVKCDDVEMLWQGDEKYWGGRAPNPFPFIARLFSGGYTYKGKRYEMPIHGFAPTTEFLPVTNSGDGVVFELNSSDETKKVYPFDFSLRLSYNLDNDKLTVTYSLENKSDDTMYFGVGGHPGFNVPFALEDPDFESYYLQFSPSDKPRAVVLDERCFVTGDSVFYEGIDEGGKLPLRHDLFDNDAFILYDMKRNVRLCGEKSGKYIEVNYPDYEFCAFWHKPQSDAPYLCIEPWSSLPGRGDVVEDIEKMPTLLSLPEGMVHESRIEYIFGM